MRREAVIDLSVRRLGGLFELQDPAHARLLPMEGLRGVAVTLVFLQHYSVQGREIGLRPGPAGWFASVFRDYGNLGVELFFVLSGYLIYGTLVRRAPSFGAFMARRVQRIYPTFLAVFAVALALTFLVPIPGKIPDGAGRAALYIAANLALLPGLIPIRGIVEVAWSLSYEMFFYVACAALVLGGGVARMPEAGRTAVVTALSAAFLAASCAGLPGFPLRMMPFFAGMLLAEGLGERIPAWAAWFAAAASFSVSVSRALSGATSELVQTACLAALCGVCFRGAGTVSAGMTWAPLRWLGNMSYSYYLVHGFVVRIVMVLLGRFLPAGMPDWLFWTVLPVVYCLTLAVGAALFLIVEKPLSLRPDRPGSRPQRSDPCSGLPVRSPCR